MLSSLSVIVPAYNEQETLAEVVTNLLAKLKALAGEYEVIIVDDGSRDRTFEIAEGMAKADARVRIIRHPFNIGYGAAQKSGIIAAKCDYLTLIPSDGQFDVEDMGKFAAA